MNPYSSDMFGVSVRVRVVTECVCASSNCVEELNGSASKSVRAGLVTLTFADVPEHIPHTHTRACSRWTGCVHVCVCERI